MWCQLWMLLHPLTGQFLRLGDLGWGHFLRKFVADFGKTSILLIFMLTPVSLRTCSAQYKRMGSGLSVHPLPLDFVPPCKQLVNVIVSKPSEKVVKLEAQQQVDERRYIAQVAALF